MELFCVFRGIFDFHERKLFGQLARLARLDAEKSTLRNVFNEIFYRPCIPRKLSFTKMLHYTVISNNQKLCGETALKSTIIHMLQI